MATKESSRWPELAELLDRALRGEKLDLEKFLQANSQLPGPRMNLAVVNDFAGLVGQLVIQPDLPVEQLETLLDGWAALSLAEALVNQPAEILPAAAVLSYGQVATVRPDWWEDETGKLHKAASDGRWRTREIVALALQKMLKADWERTYELLQSWLGEADPLVIRAVVAGIAEPPLLTNTERGEQALALIADALTWLENLPTSRRREEGVEVLRKALGYAVSVAVAAAPDPGFALLEKLAASPDKDIHWILRENLKKQRLQRWPERVAALQRTG